MKGLYAPKLVQIKTHWPVPRSAAAPSPPKPKSYEKSAGASGVINLLQMVIDDAHCEELEFEADENKAQKMYGECVSSSTASFEADRARLLRRRSLWKTSLELSMTEESQVANGEMLESLRGTLSGLRMQSVIMRLRDEVLQPEAAG